MISKSLAKDVLNAGASTGADYVEIYIEDTNSSSISIENGKVETAMVNNAYGAGIRLLKELRSVYGYTNDVSKNGLLKLATTLAASFNGKQIVSVDKLKTKNVKNLSPLKKPASVTSNEEKIAKLKEATGVLTTFDPRIVRSIATFISIKKDVQLVSTKGIQFFDSKERVRIGLVAVAFENGIIENDFEGPGASSGMEYFEEGVDIKQAARKVCENAIRNLTAKPCPSGKMPVVMGNGFGGVLFHESCGHPLEASSVAKKLSCFSDSLGKQIASPIVNAFDDGTIPNGWGSNNIDDEGNKTEKTQLIKNGICTNFLIDEFNGRRMNMAGNGACRRQNYKYEPTSRMSNTYIDNGTSTPEEIIAATKLGLYAKSMGGGSVNPVTGEFNFSVSEAYIIRDGKVCEPVRGATLIGHGYEILKKIDMIGNDLKRAQGMCGASSGSIPTDVGQPTLRISEVTVGGQGGELK